MCNAQKGTKTTFQSFRQASSRFHHPLEEELDCHGQPSAGTRHPVDLLLGRTSRGLGRQDRVRQLTPYHQQRR